MHLNAMHPRTLGQEIDGFLSTPLASCMENKGHHEQLIVQPRYVSPSRQSLR
jgi:hypothetical protein